MSPPLPLMSSASSRLSPMCIDSPAVAVGSLTPAVQTVHTPGALPRLALPDPYASQAELLNCEERIILCFQELLLRYKERITNLELQVCHVARERDDFALRCDYLAERNGELMCALDKYKFDHPVDNA